MEGTAMGLNVGGTGTQWRMTTQVVTHTMSIYFLFALV